MNEDLLNNPENPCESNAFGGGATLSSNRKGFTLAETLLVVVILGVIATLTVPNLINKQKETTQRTKVKKAMAAYEQAVNKMLLEHDRSFGNLNTAGCNTKTSYFKYIKRDTTNTCIFQAPDKLWWDVSDIERPLIAFEQSNLTVQKANAKDNKDAFVMVGRYDDQGILRVDDLNYETLHSLKDANNYESKAQLEKLYGFVINKAEQKEIKSALEKCREEDKTQCTVEVDGDNITYNIKTVNSKTVCKDGLGTQMKKYDSKTGETDTNYCSINERKALWVSPTQQDITPEEAKSAENCKTSTLSETECLASGDYYQAAANKCQKQGGRLPTTSELVTMQLSGIVSGTGKYWVSEENSSTSAYEVNASRVGYVNYFHKASSGFHYVCVAD